MKLMNVIAAVVLLGTSGAGFAQAPPEVPATVADRFDAMLRSIDVVPPDRAALEAAVPDAWQRLDAVARDAKRDQWSRIRAVSLLSYFPEARTQVTLEAVSTDRDKEVRRQAIYTLGRGFGATGDIKLVRFIEAHAGDAELEVAEHAVRSLRWVNHPEAKAALERLSKKGPAVLRTLARTTIDKRELRMKSPERGH